MSTAHTPLPGFNREFFTNYRHLLRADCPMALTHQRYGKGHATGSHRHEDFYAFYLVRAGRGVHCINGHPYAVTRGDVYITRPGTIHSYRDFQGLQAEAIIFQAEVFGARQLEALRAQSGFWTLFAAGGPSGARPFENHRLHLPPQRYLEIEGLVRQIDDELHEPSPVGPLLAQGLFFQLLIKLARWQGVSAPGASATTGTSSQASGAAAPSGPIVAHEELLAQVLELCETHFAEGLTVPQLAAQAFLSPSRFSEVFVERCGMPPAAYLRRLRLERAQTLLRTSSLSAAAIAHQAGFRDAPHLARSFRAAFGLTPTAYRSQFKR